MREWRLKTKEKQKSQTPKRRNDAEEDDGPPKKRPKDMSKDEYKEHKR